MRSFVLPFDNMEVAHTTRTRADGSIEFFVSSHDLDESHNVMIFARQPVTKLQGRQVVRISRQVVRISPGETRGNLTIEVGAVVAVSGVVDARALRFRLLRVECGAWRKDTAPTGLDGTFRMTIA